MVRFQDQVSVFRVTVPYGGRLTEGPPPESFIDRWVLSKLRTLELPPSETCDDATFLRRTSIDITGRLPTPGQARKFLEDPDPAKRGKWVDELLASPEYADYFANKWSAILRNKRRDERSTRGNFLFHAWIRQSLLENKPYDRWMKEIVTASGELGRNPAVTWFREVKSMEDQVQDAARSFWESGCSAPVVTTIPTSDGASRTTTALPPSFLAWRASREPRPGRKSFSMIAERQPPSIPRPSCR